MKKILLVEDEAIIALSEAGIIERHGYKIITAYNGEAAVESIRTDPDISLVLMDIDLGTGIDGNETARRILAQRELPIVFLTSHAEKYMVDKVKDITRYGYVLKNTGEFVLIESIAMAYELFQAHRAIEKENEERKKTEKLFRERNKFIETVIGNLPIGLSVNSLDPGDNLYMNRSFEEIYGLSLEEMKDKETFFKRAYPDPEYRESVKKRVSEDIASGDPERMQWENLRVTHADGSERIVSAEMIPLYEQNLVISTVQDTTLHREAEERLIESEKKYADLFEYSPIVLWEEDFSRVVRYLDSLRREGVEDLASYVEKHPEIIDICVPLIQVTDINRATMKLLGTDTKEIALGSLKKTFTPTSSGMLKGELTAIWEGKTLVEDTGSIYPPTGQREVIIRWQALPGCRAPYERVIVSFLDITDLKKNEEELRTKELQSKQLFEQSGMGIILADETHTVIDANPYACECLRYSIEEMRGLTAVDLIHPDDILLSSPEDNLKKLKEENSVELERRFRTRNGSYIYVLVIMRKLTGFDERVSHVIMFRDITQRKVAEKRVVDLLKEKELLLKEVHHRIKNDMTTISSILSLQSSSIHSEEAKTALEEAERRISLMQRIYDLLYTGENIRSLDISTYLTSIVETIREYTKDSVQIGIEMDFEAIEVPMKQAFPIGIIVNELITNARKYAFPGRDRGIIRTSVRKGENDYIEIRVSDDGIGFPEQYVSEENTSGFGMILVRAYAAQYGGEVNMESKKGEGSTITVSLKKG